MRAPLRKSNSRARYRSVFSEALNPVRRLSAVREGTERVGLVTVDNNTWQAHVMRPIKGGFVCR